MSRKRLAVLVLLWSMTMTGPASKAELSSPEGHWEGAIEIQGLELGVVVELQRVGEEWSGTIDIPLQGAEDLTLEGIAVEGTSIGFRIAGVPGEPTFAGVLKGGEVSGTFSQGGQRFPFSLSREEGRAALSRPQEPKPPFPYHTEEVSYTNGKITLQGTLTLPPGNGKYPGVVLISGSGAQNRDEEIFGHKPFLLLADHLTRAGIAVLRSDDRGVGGSTGDLSQSTTEDLAGDALAALSLLQEHPWVDEKRIGLLGHSEGGIVAPLAASRSPEVSFLVLLAPTAVSGQEVVEQQIKTLLRQAGAPEEEIEAQLLRQRKAVELLTGDLPEQEIRAGLAKVIRAQLEAVGHPEDGLEEIVQAQVDGALSPWGRFFLAYDPRLALERIKVPLLALFGELDTQVDPAQNRPELEKALGKAGAEDVTVKVLPGLNHLFQKASTGLVAEYALIEETMNERVLGLVTTWIEDRFGPDGSPAVEAAPGVSAL